MNLSISPTPILVKPFNLISSPSVTYPIYRPHGNKNAFGFPDQKIKIYKQARLQWKTLAREIHSIIKHNIRDTEAHEHWLKALNQIKISISNLAQYHPETALHSIRATRILNTLTKEYPDIFDTLCSLRATLGMLVHDIGKLLIPLNILDYPWKLTEQQRTIIDTHSARGLEILGPGFLREQVGEIVTNHHQPPNISNILDIFKWPWITHLISAVDIIEALTGTRAYRRPMPMEEALKELNQFPALNPTYVALCQEGLRSRLTSSDSI